LPHLHLKLEPANGLLLFVPEIELDGAAAAFSTRVRLAPTGPKFCNFGYYGIPGAQASRKRLCDALALPPERLTTGEQTHTANIAVINEELAGRGGFKKETRIPTTDGHVTNLPRTPLAVMTAMCVPVLLHDPRSRSIAAVHAGWRGADAGILANAVAAMRANYGADPRNITALIGPHIGPCCYVIGEELAARITVPEALEQKPGGIYLDLGLWCTALLRAAGVPAANIHLSRVCTACHTELLFSYRADKKRFGTNASIIALTD